MGIFKLLDSQCKTPKATDLKFCAQVYQEHGKHPCLLVPKRRPREDVEFTVKHFAGDVTYSVEGWLEKNNDTLHSDFSEEMGKASQQVLAFCSHPRSPSFAELAPRLTLPHARNPGAPPPDTGRGVGG